MKTKIYGLKDINGELRYIGRTSRTLNIRLSQHICTSKNKNNHKQCWILNCLSKGYRPSIFLIEEVYGDGYNEEQEYIKLFKKLGFRLVNASDGGKGPKGYKMTKEHKYKLSIAHKGKPSGNKGKKASQETIEKIRIAVINQSNETRTKRKLAKIGTHPTQQARLNKSKALGGKPFICIENNKKYDLTTDAAKELKLQQGNISACLRKERNHTGGYHFKYVDEINSNDNQQRDNSGDKGKGK